MSEGGSWFHCSVKPISRSAGRSAVAAAAYRCGERLHDQRTAITHDYTRRSGVEAAFIVAPDHAPSWAHDWGRLWNAAEICENRSNSRTAREVELALPASVSGAERQTLARLFALHLVERYGVAVAVALHEPSNHGDGRNYHAHILMTTRRMGAEGLGEKTRELDDKKTGAKEIRHIREYAAELINGSLADSGSSERVDHRSHKERGIEQLPTEHLGVKASAMERRGERSERGDLNREITEGSQRITALNAEIAETQKPQTARELHYDQVEKFKTALQTPKLKKLALRICEQEGYKFIQERIREYEQAAPPINPLDPTTPSSYRGKLQRERETQGNDKGMDR